MVIKNNTIFYFSGTGNSFQVAKDINNELGKFEVCPLAEIADEKEIKVECKMIGIVFPVIYARLPLVVEKFVKRLIADNYTYIFAAATHGGTPAQVLIKLRNILKSNCVTLNAGFLIHMPANNIFSYNPASVKRHNNIFKKEKVRIKEIASIITRRKNYKCETSKLVIDIIIDKVFIKVTDKIMENLHNRDKEFWINENCNGCRLCENICPVKNINFSSNVPAWQHNCEGCTACIQFCPKEAIQWGNKTIKRRRYKNPNIHI